MKNNVIYVQSLYTGDVYKMTQMPSFGGYKMVGLKEYLEYCKKYGMKP